MILKFGLSIAFVALFTVLSPSVAVSKELPDVAVLRDKIKHSSESELGCLIYSYAVKSVQLGDLLACSSLLENKEIVLARDDPKRIIYVRDVALALIQERTGESFLPTNKKFAVKAVFSCKSKDDVRLRFQILSLSDKDFDAVKAVIDQWISNR